MKFFQHPNRRELIFEPDRWSKTSQPVQGAAVCDLLSLDSPSSPWPFLKNHPDTSTITNEVALLKYEILPILKIKTKKESFGKNREKDAGEKSFGSRPFRTRPNALTCSSMPGGRDYHRQKARNEAKKEEKAQLRAAGLWKVWSIYFCLHFIFAVFLSPTHHNFLS